MATAIFEVDNSVFERKALAWAQQFEEICYLQSNGYHDEYSSVDSLLAVEATYTVQATGKNCFTKLEKFKAEYPNNWMLGFFNYDLKYDLEDLVSPFVNFLEFPDIFFFIPKTILKFYKNQVEIASNDPSQVFNAINNFTADPVNLDTSKSFTFEKRFTKSQYMEAFDKMIGHIRRGDIYEVNLCQEFFAEESQINALEVYRKLNEVSPTPFSTFFKLKDKYILSASPERFLAKRENILISQPIKGTAKRGKNQLEDLEIIKQLQSNPKEIAENVMIVDLVRNDMTRSAKPGSVAAERRLEVHTFKQVHQLISTITCIQNDEISDIQAIANIFPPGSMTGAPKISAMKICDNLEASRRGVYAGAVGYFAPNGDFDFNVVIRTLLYNATKKYLSFHTGGAITIDANAESEYQECLLKASAILKTLDATLKED